MMQLLGGGELPADVMFLEQMLDQEEPGTPSLISSFDTHVGGRGGTARVGSPHTTFGSSFDTQVGRGGRASPAPFDAQVGSPAAATAFGSSFDRQFQPSERSATPSPSKSPRSPRSRHDAFLTRLRSSPAYHSLVDGYRRGGMDEVYKLLKNTDDAFQRESAESRIALEDEMKAQGSGMPRAPPPAKPTWSAKVDLAPKVVSPDKPVVSFAEIVRAEEEQLREAAKQGAGKKAAAAAKKKAVSTTAQFSAELAAKAQQKRKAAAKQKKG